MTKNEYSISLLQFYSNTIFGIFHSFKGDIGTPLVQKGKAVGILTVAPQTPNDPLIFTEIRRFYGNIRFIMKPRILKDTRKLPRTVARFDWNYDFRFKSNQN